MIGWTSNSGNSHCWLARLGQQFGELKGLVSQSDDGVRNLPLGAPGQDEFANAFEIFSFGLPSGQTPLQVCKQTSPRPIGPQRLHKGTRIGTPAESLGLIRLSRD